MDEAGKMVSEDGTEVTVEGGVEDQEVEKDEDGQEVIKVYIFKADSGEDDMGEEHSGSIFLSPLCDQPCKCKLSISNRVWEFNGLYVMVCIL